MTRNKLVLLLSFAIILFSGSAITSAAPANDITVTPFLQSVVLKPDETEKSFDMQITNNASTAQKLNLSVINFGSLDETGGIVYQGSNNNVLIKKYGLADWLSLSVNQVTLDPHQSTTVTATVENKNNLRPGGHYGAIITSTDNPNSSGDAQVSIKQKVSSLVFATKQGGEKYDLHLEEVRDNSSWFQAPTAVTLKFANKGNTQLVPRGVVSLFAGQTLVARGVINEQSSYVLPETSRLFDVGLKELAKQKTVASTKYRMQVDYRYDGYDAFATMTKEIKVLNPWFIAICFFTFASVIIGFLRFRKPRAKKKKTKK